MYFPLDHGLAARRLILLIMPSSWAPQPSWVSAVGADELGDQTVQQFEKLQLDTQGVGCSKLPTGTVQVTLDERGHPSYEIVENVAWDDLHWSTTLQHIAQRTQAVCFGSLAQRSELSREAIHRFMANVPRESIKVFDVNLRAPFFDKATVLQSLELANVLKLSDEELPIVADYCELSGAQVDILQQLALLYELQAVALTCGPHGATIYRDGQVSLQPAVATKVVDTVGAGDAFTAFLTVGLLTGHELSTINHHACRAAAYVCSQSGATPQLPKELLL